MANAVVTLSKDFEEVSALTHPTIKAYADKIGADFVVIDKVKLSTKFFHYEKFQIFDLLTKYKRIIYLDSDITIRPDCPNLFDVVPEHKLGLFNEGRFMDMTGVMQDACRRYKISLPKWERQSYNAGVMVLSRLHRGIFKKPEGEEYDVFGAPVGVYHYEQPYLNLKIISEGYVVQELTHNFNRLSIMDQHTGENHLSSYIVHYAGVPKEHRAGLIAADLKSWETTAPDYKYKKNIRILVGGGLGDQIDEEPVVRFICEKMHPGENIKVCTDFPELFRHLPVDIKKNPWKVDDGIVYYTMEALPPPTAPIWQFMAQTLCHSTDFASLSTLRRTLPNSDKQIRLTVELEDIASLVNTVGIRNLADLILVHPGRGWASKTLPPEYWQGIIDGLVEKGLPVAVIGKYVSEEQGLVDVQCPEGVLDLRNLLTLKELIALISQAKVLVSNDSSPIHIAGAFDGWIVLLPTCKHPDHVLPFRHGRQDYKTLALYDKLVCDSINSSPMQVDGQTIDYVPGKIEDYLMGTSKVVSKIAGVFQS
jgi:lipopolysaccharide biosynthesis glycosyltransferase